MLRTETTMDFFAYLRAIRKSWWIVVLLVALGGGGMLARSERATPVYAGHVGFYVSTPNLSSQTALGSDQFAQDRATTYAQLLSSDRLAGLIRRSEPDLGLSTAALAAKISGAAQLNTIIVTATVKDTSKPRLRTIVDAVASDFPLMVSQLDKTQGAQAEVSLNVVSGPSVGSAPISPRTKLNVAIGIVIGLVLGLLIAVLRDLLDSSLTRAEDLGEVTGAPVLGAVGFDSLARRDPLVVAERANGLRAEEFRQLRTNVQFIDATERLKVLVVTSSVEGEGKSTTATNLALVFAENGTKVLLVEADLRRPKVSDYLGLERAVGLTSVLTHRVALQDAVQPWGTLGLDVLASGPLPPNPSELLGGRGMRALVDEMRERYDLVIIDTPPVLPVTDAAVLSSYTDGALVVFRANGTRRAHVAAAVRALRAVDARVIGCVLNMRPARGIDSAGYHPYYTAEKPKRHLLPRWLRRRSAAPEFGSEGLALLDDLAGRHLLISPPTVTEPAVPATVGAAANRKRGQAQNPNAAGAARQRADSGARHANGTPNNRRTGSRGSNKQSHSQRTR